MSKDVSIFNTKYRQIHGHLTGIRTSVKRALETHKSAIFLMIYWREVSAQWQTGAQHSGIEINPLGSAVSPAIPAHFFPYQCKRDSNYSVDFDLTYKCCTSFDPVKFVFFLWNLTIKTKCCAFRLIKKNKHDARSAFSLSVKSILKRVLRLTVTPRLLVIQAREIFLYEAWILFF
jgi:hypothetical protein